MLASRLLSTLMMLQTRGRMTAAALAAEFEVSVRTVHRDMDGLSAAGIPVYADRGRGGGFRLRDGYRTTLTGLTGPEAEALFLSGLPGAAAELGLSEILASARLKLLSALPAEVQPGAERISARFHLDAATWFRGTDRQAFLPSIAKAVWGDRMLRIEYRRAGEACARPRRLAPLGLVLKGGVWYLVALAGASTRTYRISNVRRARVCRERFARPAGFNLAAHWERASREYEAGLYRESALVRLSPDGVRLLGILGPHAEDAFRRTAGRPGRNGWVRCVLPLESSESGVRELLRLGEEVEVVGPPALREKLAGAARRIAAAYAARGDTRG